MTSMDTTYWEERYNWLNRLYLKLNTARAYFEVTPANCHHPQHEAYPLDLIVRREELELLDSLISAARLQADEQVKAGNRHSMAPLDKTEIRFDAYISKRPGFEFICEAPTGYTLVLGYTATGDVAIAAHHEQGLEPALIWDLKEKKWVNPFDRPIQE